jgi:hypothetical protein
MEEIRDQIKTQATAGDQLLKNLAHDKTFGVILNEYLLGHLQSAFTRSRPYTTLE